uniref:Uncharacterized protein n=1 Tax=Arundo donax TaxID=35708 RepID=A0A0A8ZNQ3_ARUDO
MILGLVKVKCFEL